MMIHAHLILIFTLSMHFLNATSVPAHITTCTDTHAASITDFIFLRYPYRPVRIGHLIVDGVRSTTPSVLFSYKYDKKYDGTFSPQKTASLSKKRSENNVLFRLCMYAGRLYFESICKHYVLELLDSGEFINTEIALERGHFIYYFDTIEQFMLIDQAIRRCAQKIKNLRSESCEIYIGSTCYSITEDKKNERFYAVKHLPGNRIAPEAIQLTHLLLTEWVTRRRPTVDGLFAKPTCCVIS